ncbi:MAG TPA: prepilin peptidase [Vulgatibacter sp.]|nr:prepilin peptidase [Vulgatibacter sp.]
MNLDLPAWYISSVAAIFGALVGSFLNVVIARVPKGLSVVRPGSRCPRCLRPIAWHENVPVLSWLLLRGRCRGCRLPISIRYPLVELATALLAVACVRQFGPTPWAVAAFAFLAALVALTYIDLDHWLLPRRITIPFIGLGAAASLLEGGPGIASSALGAASGFAAFIVVGYVAERILKKEALGGGDLWLFAMIGAWLGAKALLPVALLASAQGSIIGVILLTVARRKARLQDPALALDAAEGEVAALDPTADASAPEVSTGGVFAADVPAAGAPADGGPAAGSPGAGDAVPLGPAPVTALPPPKPTGDAELDAWVPPEGAVPFGPFLALGAAEYLFFGERLVDGYLSLIAWK